METQICLQFPGLKVTQVTGSGAMLIEVSLVPSVYRLWKKKGKVLKSIPVKKNLTGVDC